MIQKTPGVGFFGKVRIPTIGHADAIEHAKKIAAKKNAQLHIGLSGTSHPLTPESKREHAEKLFNHPVMPASKHTSSIISFLSHMNKQHDDFTLVAGGSRSAEYKQIISKYNGKPDSQGNIPFNFRKWRVHGVDRITAETRKSPTTMSHDELTKTVSATKLEALANKGNYEHFAAYYPNIPRSHVRKLYNQIRMGNKSSRPIVAQVDLKENIGQTLGRDLMPQIEKQHVSSFLKHLKKQGISHSKKTVASNSLKSTQSEFDREKIAALVHAKNKERIFTSNDEHVLDGHHRWLANKHTGQDTKTYKIDLPILELLRQAREYTGGLQENTETHTFDDILDDFTSFVGTKLGIKKLPPVIRDSSIQGSFGGYVPSEKCIKLATKDRHPLDVLRTLAHELVHHKQNEDGCLSNPEEDGKTGSNIENEANALAGQIMRHWAKANPNHFELQSLTENIAIFVVGVPCSGKDKILKDEFQNIQEVDIQRLQKTNLSEKVIVSSGADKLNELSEAIAYLDELGYHTSLVYVYVDNKTSKLRNEQRGIRGQRVIKEKTRQVKYDLSENNREILMNLFSEDFAFVNNTPELKSKPKHREWGTNSLTKIYKSMTPGQTKKDDNVSPNTDVGVDGIGYSIPVNEWMKNPRTIERFTNRYGKDAQYRINEVAKMFQKTGITKTSPKTLMHIRESFTSKSKNNK